MLLGSANCNMPCICMYIFREQLHTMFFGKHNFRGGLHWITELYAVLVVNIFENVGLYFEV